MKVLANFLSASIFRNGFTRLSVMYRPPSSRTAARHEDARHQANGGSAPATPGFTAVAPEWLPTAGAAQTAPVILAAESTLGSHPCVALSSAQATPEWITPTPPINAFAANGHNPLNFVSHSWGSLQFPPLHPPPVKRTFLLGTIRTFSFGGDIRQIPIDRLGKRL